MNIIFLSFSLTFFSKKQSLPKIIHSPYMSNYNNMYRTFHPMHFDRTINRAPMHSDPSFQPEANQSNNYYLQQTQGSGLLNVENNNVSLPELTTSPAFSVGYFDDSDYSPFNELENMFSPVMTTQRYYNTTNALMNAYDDSEYMFSPLQKTQQSELAESTLMYPYDNLEYVFQPAKMPQQNEHAANVSMELYEDLLHSYNMVDDEYEQDNKVDDNEYTKQVQAVLLAQWTGTSQGKIESPAGYISQGPAVPFNGDPHLLVIDKSKVAEFNPVTSPESEDQDTESFYDGENQTNDQSSMADLASEDEDEQFDEWFDGEGQQDAPRAESHDDKMANELFPPLDGHEDPLFEMYADNNPEVKRAFGLTDSPLSVLSNDSDMGCDGGNFIDEQANPQDDEYVEEQEEQESVVSEDEEEAVEDDAEPAYETKRKRAAPSDDDEYKEDSAKKAGPSKRRRKTVVKQSAFETRRKRKVPTDENDYKEEADNAGRAAPSKKRRTSDDNKPFECHLCGHRSKRRYNLNTHMKTHNEDRVREFPCTECEKAFDRRHDRDRHIATVHQGRRAYECKECDAQFSRGDALTRHMDKHLEDDVA
jgi:hypothetical protein